MIRYKEKEFMEWSICPATGDIFDANNGVVQKIHIIQKRPYFNSMPVHQIMAHTFFGWKPGFVVHHKDENKLNNTLSNLVYLTNSEHRKLHAGELLHEETRAKLSAAMKGKHLSEETKAKLSAANKGKPAWNKGKHPSAETRAKLSAAALLREAKKTRKKESFKKLAERMKGNTKGFKKRRGKDRGVEETSIAGDEREVERSRVQSKAGEIVHRKS